MDVSGQLHVPAALSPGKDPPSVHWLKSWVGPRAGLGEGEKILALPGIEYQPIYIYIYIYIYKYL
jgi:hypothetical protein